MVLVKVTDGKVVPCIIIICFRLTIALLKVVFVDATVGEGKTAAKEIVGGIRAEDF